MAVIWAAACGVIMLSALRLAAALTPARYAPRARLSNHDLPVISVIIALYDEAEVLPGLIAALSRLDYPRRKLDIILALEAHDRPHAPQPARWRPGRPCASWSCPRSAP
jgi:cellulose synthase/poly-beta-1,6-N-acetylglucosamine synthase-like glycosyltransferase